MIRFEILDPRPSELQKTLELIQEWKSEGFKLIGFEVTVPQQANLLDRNIDPQHSGGDASKSCIMECFSSPFWPSNGKWVFCTNRADLDSVGGMALYVINLGSNDIERDSYILEHRVDLVHNADIFSKGKWAPRPLFSEGYEQPELGAIARAVADFKIPVEQRVQWMKDWLWSGAEPKGYREQYERERQGILHALESEETKVSVYYNVAVVQSRLRAATSIGYSKAPVVVAYNPEMPSKNGPYKKFTICQYALGYCDLNGVLTELQALEPGWGGSPTIIGSPQEADSILQISQVIDIVQKHVKVDPKAGIKNPAEYIAFEKADQAIKSAYKQYVAQEWNECESYSYASGNNPYAWDCFVGESFNEWMQKNNQGEPHCSLWHNKPVGKFATA